MASSDYEIITDPWDPKCVSACCMYFPVQEPEDTELLLEKIRGKLDERIHNHTLAEEYRIINEQIVKSQGFDVDFSKLRYLFDFQPAFLDDSDNDTGRDFFRKLSAEAIEIYNKREGTSFEFVEVEKANIYSNSGEVFFITFVAKDSWNQTKVFQAKVIHVFCREIVHSFCRLKPNQPGLKIKPGCINSNLKGDGLGLGDKQAAQPKSKEQRSSEATYENRAEGDEYKQRMMSELANRFFALASFDLS
ncbi:uncharacterized protein LOC103845122 isoform X6 [Brassica rapa]|uniref:uncharacterized protein LOC103845122 isoform X6 n=1 Tax=Brassica campestris TaxID=3711 RepID=UPI00142E1DD6|nr:uncharacterized protein LOC103845122 isoform X6 [Brassica rapa]